MVSWLFAAFCTASWVVPTFDSRAKRIRHDDAERVATHMLVELPMVLVIVGKINWLMIRYRVEPAVAS
jgi:hypothetical protein